jgi:hypothetical protein
MAAGLHPDARDEPDEPTPLMVAAARGDLSIVEVLVDAGADPNTQVDDQSGESEQFAFLDRLFATGKLECLFALAYAVLYDQPKVRDYLAPKTAPQLQTQADAIERAKGRMQAPVRPCGEPQIPNQKTKSAARAERETLLKRNAKARRWVNKCLLCGREGYNPDLPDEVDDKGTAQRLRKRFPPLTIDKNHMCRNCVEKVARGLQERHSKRR